VPSHPPIVRRFIAPTEEQVAESRAATVRFRSEMDAKRESARPARRAAILAGPALHDVDAAVACPCACHPRPADDDLHDGGVSCQCQETDEQRVARRRAFLEPWSAPADDFSDHHLRHEQRMERFDAEAFALGVEARIEVSAAPFVIVGTCEGRGFYLRERHGGYRVTIAPDDDPGSDPWAADPTETSIEVAAGDAVEFDSGGFFSPAMALRIAVTAVRTALARNTCPHRSVGTDPYCPLCGVAVAEADAWRWAGLPDTGGR